MNEGLDRYQLAGLDDRERGFSRPVDCEQAEGGYRTVLRYETVRISTHRHPTPDNALLSLIHILQAKGFRQLKTQISFRNGVYLGSQELWIDYPDPPPTESIPSGLMAKLSSWFRSRIRHE